MLKNNYHTHTLYCNHAVGHVEDYVLKAISLGMEELGMSDHNPLDIPYFNAHGIDNAFIHKFATMDTFENKYLKEIEECQEKYQGKIKIYKGVEAEFFLDDLDYYKKLRSKVDYMILGIHFYIYNGQFINIFGDIHPNYENVDVYFKTAIDAMNSGLYKYFAHPDIIFARYTSKDGKRTFDEKIKKGFRDIIECAIKNDVILEINAGGMRNSAKWGLKESVYPTKEFFNMVKEYKDAKVIIGADCHDPELLNCVYTDNCEKFAKELGIKVLDKLEF